MTRKNGELSANGIDREQPLQIAVPTDRMMGEDHDMIHECCGGLSVCPRGHTLRRDEVHVRRLLFHRRVAC